MSRTCFSHVLSLRERWRVNYGGRQVERWGVHGRRSQSWDSTSPCIHGIILRRGINPKRDYSPSPPTSSHVANSTSSHLLTWDESSPSLGKVSIHLSLTIPLASLMQVTLFHLSHDFALGSSPKLLYKQAFSSILWLMGVWSWLDVLLMKHFYAIGIKKTLEVIGWLG